MEMRISNGSKAPTVCAKNLLLFLVPTVWTDVNILSLKFFPTQLMKPAKDMAKKLLPRASPITPLRWRILAAVSLWIIMRRKVALTGSLCFVRCMPVANTTTAKVKVMNFRLEPTVWVPAPRSIPANTWMLPFTLPAQNTRCILKRAKMWADCRRSLIRENGPVPLFVGGRISMCLPTLPFLPNTLSIL